MSLPLGSSPGYSEMTMSGDHEPWMFRGGLIAELQVSISFFWLVLFLFLDAVCYWTTHQMETQVLVRITTLAWFQFFSSWSLPTYPMFCVSYSNCWITENLSEQWIEALFCHYHAQLLSGFEVEVSQVVSCCKCCSGAKVSLFKSRLKLLEVMGVIFFVSYTGAYLDRFFVSQVLGL